MITARHELQPFYRNAPVSQTTKDNNIRTLQCNCNVQIGLHTNRIILKTNNIELYKYYDTPPLPLLHNYQILLFLQRFYHHSYTLPDVFVTYFTKISSIHNYSIRGKRNLYFTTTETQTGKKLSRIKVAYYGINFPKALKQLSLWLSLNIELEIILFIIIWSR